MYRTVAAPEPPEAQSIRSMLHIVRILAIIFGVLILLGGIAIVAYMFWVAGACSSFGFGVGAYCGAAVGVSLVWVALLFIFGIVDFVIYSQMRHIEQLMDQRRYEEAKASTLVWTIIGFILGGIILGIILLIAYLKFDPVINWQRTQGSAASSPVSWAAPPGSAVAPVPPAAPSPPISADRFCPACGAGNSRISAFCERCGRPLSAQP